MKNANTHTCKICGTQTSVVIGGKETPERLCIQCLVVTYPALKELEKVL